MNGHDNRKNTQGRKREREKVINERDIYIQTNIKKLIIKIKKKTMYKTNQVRSSSPVVVPIQVKVQIR